MIASHMITEEEVVALLSQAGVTDTSSIDQGGFEAFVDSMVEEDPEGESSLD